jgi:transcriptional regulator with XRE-family HTH domain
MTHSGPTQEVARHVKELRRDRGMTAAELAARMTELGVKWDRSIVANLESGRRRTVSVDELLALAVALDIAPVHLIAGIEDDDGKVPVTPDIVIPRSDLRRWIRGFKPLLGTDIREWRRNVPVSEAVGLWVWVGNEEDLDERIAGTKKRLAEYEQLKQNRDHGA